jgi:hypothetical protein
MFGTGAIIEHERGTPEPRDLERGRANLALEAPMVAAWFVVGDSPAARELPLSLLGGTLLLMGALAVAAIIIIYIGRWVKRPKTQTSDDLTYYRLLYEKGEFSREEYERIRAKLGQRLREELDLPLPGETPAPPGPEGEPDPAIRAGKPGQSAPPPPAEPPPG